MNRLRNPPRRLAGVEEEYHSADEEEAASVASAHTPNNSPPASDAEDEVMTDYDQKDTADKADALNKAISQLKGYAFDQDDLDFYFNQVEIKMDSAGVGKQFTKLQALSTILPPHVTSQIKPLLRKKASEFTENDAYLQVKTKILQIFCPPADAAFNRAFSRVLTDKPSTLARDLVSDLCSQELEGCCCAKIIYGAWKKHLPSNCKAAIANMEFNHETFEAVLQEADAVFESTRPSASVSALSDIPTSPSAHETGFHQYWAGPDSRGAGEAVAALHYQRGGRGVSGHGRGQNRGQNRGQGRGSGRGRGNNNSSQVSSNASSGSGAGGGASAHPRHKTPRHADLPPFEACKRHWTHGKSAHFCTEPWSCPWKQFFTPPSNNQ